MINEMVHLRKNEDRWEAYYHHPTTNEMWKSYFPRANGPKRGPKILRREPVPETLEERLDLCLTGSDPEDAEGLGIELSADTGQWHRVLEILEERYRKYDRRQLKRFLTNLGVLDPDSLFSEMELAPEQIDLDGDQIRKLKWRARKVKLKKLFLFW